MGAWQVSEPWGHRIAFTQMPPDIFGRRTGAGRLDWRLSQCPPYFFQSVPEALRPARRGSGRFTDLAVTEKCEQITKTKWEETKCKIKPSDGTFPVIFSLSLPWCCSVQRPLFFFFLTVIPNKLKQSSLWFPSPVVLEAAGNSARFPRGSLLSSMVSFRIPRSSCCSRVRSIRGLECCRCSYHWASGSPCGQTQRVGYCCHLMEGFPCASLEFAVSSVACWGTRLPSAWTSSYLGSCMPRTATGPPGRTPVRHTQQSVHSSRFWFSAATTFPRAG